MSLQTYATAQQLGTDYDDAAQTCYDEGSQPDYDTDFANPDAQEASQEWYVRKQK